MRFIRNIFVLIAVLLLSIGTANAGKRDKPPEKTKTEYVAKPLNWNITVNFASGVVTGGIDWDRALDEEATEFSNRVIYGGGASLDIYPRPVYALGVNFEYIFKQTAEKRYRDIRAMLWSASFIYNFTQPRKTVPFGKVSIGSASIWWPSYSDGDDWDLGSHSFFRIGFGLFTHTHSFTNTRFEIHYTRIQGGDCDLLDKYGKYFGIDLGVGIPF